MEQAEQIRQIIRNRLAERGAASFYDRIIYEEEITSTNDLLKKMAEEGTSGVIAASAGTQTKGRGRRGRAWETPKGVSIALSILVRPDLTPEEASRLTPVMGISAAQAIAEAAGLAIGIKWPNDLVIGTRKLSGTLTELVPSRTPGLPNAIVIGTGINVNNESFPEEISQVAVSLRQAAGRTFDTAEITAEILAKFAVNYERFLAEGFAAFTEEYNALLVGRGQEVVIETPARSYPATALYADENACLVVRKEDGTEEAIFAGEVSVRGLYHI